MFTRALQPAFALPAHEVEAVVLPIEPDGTERGVAAWLRELLSQAFDVRTGPLLTFPNRPMDQRIV